MQTLPTIVTVFWCQRLHFGGLLLLPYSDSCLSFPRSPSERIEEFAEGAMNLPEVLVGARPGETGDQFQPRPSPPTAVVWVPLLPARNLL